MPTSAFFLFAQYYLQLFIVFVAVTYVVYELVKKLRKKDHRIPCSVKYAAVIFIILHLYLIVFCSIPVIFVLLPSTIVTFSLKWVLLGMIVGGIRDLVLSKKQGGSIESKKKIQLVIFLTAIAFLATILSTWYVGSYQENQDFSDVIIDEEGQNFPFPL